MKYCDFNNCKLKPVKLIGLCKFCKNNYCHNHRLSETHLCVKLNENILKEKEILSIKLINEAMPSKKLQLC